MPVLRSRKLLSMLRLSTFVLSGAGLAIFGLGASSAQADVKAATILGTSSDVLPQAQGQVILRVDGRLGRGNVVEGNKTSAEFDLDMLRHFEARTISTSTIWSSGRADFRGASLAAVLDAIGAKGQTLRLTALNDYTIDMPVTMIETDVPILAYEMNGTLLSSRDKGPLWLIYPFDSSAKYQNEENYSRAVWQLVRIEVLP